PDALLNEVCVALQKHRKDISRDVMLLASKFTIVISDPEAPTVDDKFDSGRGIALQILEDNIEIMDSRLPIDVTLGVNAILALHISKERYQPMFDHWSKIRDAHQAINLSEGLVAAGRFFEDFRNVALAFQAFHLPLDKPVPSAQTSEQRKERI